MTVDEKKLAQSIFDTLTQAFAVTPSGPLASMQPADIGAFVTLMWPAEPVDPSLFSNPWSPTNPSGSRGAVENFATLVNTAPVMAPTYQPSTKFIDSLYQNLINGSAPTLPLDPTKQKAYDDAFKYLHVKVKDTDEEGREIEVDGDSPKYIKYKQKKQAYANALSSYLTNYFLMDKNNWPLVGPTLKPAVDNAWADLQAAEANKVETNLAILSQTDASSVNKILARAKLNFDNTTRASLNPGYYYHDAFAIPANWFSTTNMDGFTEVTIDSKNLVTSDESNIDGFEESGKVNFGLWSIDEQANGTFKQTQTSSDTKNLKINFKFKSIGINRPWFDGSILSLPGYTASPYEAGDYSTGKLDSSNYKKIFPLITTAIIVATDIKITADWDQKEINEKMTKAKAGGNVGFGPFRIGGSYTKDQNSKKVKADFVGNTITITGLQIIGWVCSVNPYCPPQISK